jgi:hypothetical protein
MMTRIYARLALLPLVLFISVLLLMRVQLYNDHDLRDLLLPEGCPAPCFIGIRPGVTSEDEALAIIKGNAWVEPRSINILETRAYPNATVGEQLSVIEWDWQHNANRFLISHANNLDGEIFTRNHIVEKIAITIHFRLGEIYSSFGSPSKVAFASIRNMTAPWGIEIFHLYPQYGFEFQSDILTCPYFNGLWMPEVRVEFSRMLPAPSGYIGYKPSTELKHGVIQRVQMFCKV